jgi:hypothetical protein
VIGVERLPGITELVPVPAPVHLHQILIHRTVTKP